MNPLHRIRRRVEWSLTTDFDEHEPASKDTMYAILILVIIVLIVGSM